MQELLPSLIAVVVLVAIATGIIAALRLKSPWLQPIAILRATVQLGLLSLVLTGIIADVRFVVGFIAVMIIAATLLVRQRLSSGPGTTAMIALVIATASTVPVLVVFGVGALPTEPRYVLAVAGITVGAVMTVSTLMGRALVAGLVAQRDEVEGWLALGATPRRAAERTVRAAASAALVPSTDQARSTGIVTLPGAFVGAVFAGASPVDAARFQLVVLACILCAGAVCVLLLARLLGAPTTIAVAEAR